MLSKTKMVLPTSSAFSGILVSMVALHCSLGKENKYKEVEREVADSQQDFMCSTFQYLPTVAWIPVHVL